MKKNNWLYWTPRILGIIFILFISIFAFDAFGGQYTFIEAIGAFFMHLIPSIVLAIFLWYSWIINEFVGGILFIILAVIFLFFFKAYENIFTFLFIILPILLIGVLFLMNSKIKR